MILNSLLRFWILISFLLALLDTGRRLITGGLVKGVYRRREV